MAECKECGGNLKKVKNKAGEIFLKCEDCGKIYKLKTEKEEAPVAKKAEPKKVEPKKASNPMECKECGGTLKKVRNKAGDIFLKCTDCGKITRFKPEVEEEEEEPVKKVVAKPVEKEEDDEMVCKVCGGDLKKVRNKAGDIFLKCVDCGKIFKYKPKEVIPPPEEEEEEEEEEEQIIPAPVVKEEPKPVKVEEEDEIAADEEEETVEEEAVEEEAPVEEEPVPAPVVEPIVLNSAKEENTDDLASIAKSLSEINTTLKALLTIISKKN